MVDIHIGDERIQEIAGGADAAGDASHLRTCPECRRAVAEYRSLFAMLDEEPAWAPTPGLADRVLRRMPRSRRPALVRFLFAAAGAALLAVPFLFVSPRPLAEAGERLLSSAGGTLAALLKPAGALLQLGGRSPLLLFAALAFVSAGIADHFLKRRLPRHH